MRFHKARHAFSLIELLIVITIIGVLAGMLAFSSVAGVDKANAARIVSDMRSLKTAAILFYTDHGRWPAADFSSAGAATGDAAVLQSYLDRNIASEPFSIVEEQGVVSLRYSLAERPAGVRKMLGKTAKESGLFGAAAGEGAYDGEHADLYMRLARSTP